MENRERKFRIWNGSSMEYNIMVGFLGAFYVQGMDKNCTACMSNFNTKYQDNIHVMELAPFKDSEGKEIYEGDLIGDWTEQDGVMVQSKLPVFFDEKLGQWAIDCSAKEDQSGSYALFRELQDFEYKVLGNIYQK